MVDSEDRIRRVGKSVGHVVEDHPGDVDGGAVGIASGDDGWNVERKRRDASNVKTSFGVDQVREFPG